jgi:hypothetical protein
MPMHLAVFIAAFAFTIIATAIDLLAVNFFAPFWRSRRASAVSVTVGGLHKKSFFEYAGPLFFACFVALIVDLLLKASEATKPNSATAGAIAITCVGVTAIGLACYFAIAFGLVMVEQEIEIHEAARGLPTPNPDYVLAGVAETAFKKWCNRLVGAATLFSWGLGGVVLHVVRFG